MNFLFKVRITIYMIKVIIDIFFNVVIDAIKGKLQRLKALKNNQKE